MFFWGGFVFFDFLGFLGYGSKNEPLLSFAFLVIFYFGPYYLTPFF